MGHIESWKNNKTLIRQSEYDGLEEHQKEGKYSSKQIESYFILFESLLAPKSNPLLAVEEALQNGVPTEHFLYFSH